MENGLAGVRRIKHRRKTRITDLPQELVSEILLWLPVESLLRCKSVRRSWNHIVKTILKNRVFAAEHLKRSRTRPSLLVSGAKPSSQMAVRRHFASICKNANVGFFDRAMERFRSASLKMFHCCFNLVRVYHCDGLVCAHEYRNRRPEILLANPSLGSFKVYNSSPLISRELVRKKYVNIKQYVGFGVDVIDDVYKLVRLVFRDGRAAQAEIRSFRKGDLKRIGGGWRKIEARGDYLWGGTPYHDQQVSCNGVYYWMDSEIIHQPGSPIMSFDFHSETFRLVATPASSSDECSRRVLLVWRSERVVLVKYCNVSIGRPPKPIELWVLSKEEEGWRKLLTIPPLDHMYHPLVFWNDDELILKSFSDNLKNGDHLASYNVLTKTYRKLEGIREMSDNDIYASTYVQSLVWFK